MRDPNKAEHERVIDAWVKEVVSPRAWVESLVLTDGHLPQPQVPKGTTVVASADVDRLQAAAGALVEDRKRNPVVVNEPKAEEKTPPPTVGQQEEEWRVNEQRRRTEERKRVAEAAAEKHRAGEAKADKIKDAIRVIAEAKLAAKQDKRLAKEMRKLGVR